MRDESWLSVCWDKAEKLGVKAASAVEPSDVASEDFLLMQTWQREKSNY